MNNDKPVYFVHMLPPDIFDANPNHKSNSILDYFDYIPLDILSRRETIPNTAKTYKDIILILNNQIEEFSYQQYVIEELLMDFEDSDEKGKTIEDAMAARYRIYDDVNFESLDVIKLLKAIILTLNYTNNNYQLLLSLVDKSKLNSITADLQEAYKYTEGFIIRNVRDIAWNNKIKVEGVTDALKLLNDSRKDKDTVLRLLFFIAVSSGIIQAFFQLTLDLNKIFNSNNEEINKSLPLNKELEELFNE